MSPCKGYNFTIDHNVFFVADGRMIGWTASPGDGADKSMFTNFAFTNNVCTTNLFLDTTSLNTYCGPTYTFAGNLLVEATGSYPAGNACPSTQDAVGFKNTEAEYYGLLPSSTYATYGTDGTAPGVDMTALLAAFNAIPQTDFVPLGTTMSDYWNFDQASGTTATDYGNERATLHDGTLSSTSLWTTSGMANGAIKPTGGTSGSVSVSSFPISSPFSFSAWVKPTSVSTTQYIASTKNGSVSAFCSG